MAEGPDRADADSRLRGEVVYLYAFDVANEIRLDRVASLLGARPAPYDLPPGRATPRSVRLSRPLVVEPAATAGPVNGRPARVSVRLHAVGVVCITVRVAFAVDSLADLHPFHNPTAADGRPLDTLARELCADVVRESAGALVRPGPVGEPEAYTAFLMTDLGGDRDAGRWLAARPREVAGLLAETPPDRLSDPQVEEVLRLQRSFEVTDLVVIDWDAALVVDLSGAADDVLFVLELANLQLEEFRWMDGVLDRYLDRAYVDLSRRRWWAFGTAAGVLHSLRQLRIDLARLADEVGHTIKFVGDWHLARVNRLAQERFHLDRWRASVADRLKHLDDLYTLTRGELFDRRMLWLEAVIVLFFAIDLLLLFFKS
ncbi:MAG TPA: hypothetical protein VM597_35045 [Gemmataceae bacterium]|nr:hypothetical protein [Gemmataceae bacterium]